MPVPILVAEVSTLPSVGGSFVPIRGGRSPWWSFSPSGIHGKECWEDERDKWIHKIGNILPLSKRKNSEAQNYDFDKKKDKYFRSKTGVASYALTTQVLSYSEWTPEVVKARQKELIAVYKKEWDL